MKSFQNTSLVSMSLLLRRVE